MKCIVVLLIATGCSAQDPRAAMEASLAKQRAAVEAQLQAVSRHAAAVKPLTPWAPLVMPVLADAGASAAPLCDPLPAAEMNPLIAAASGKTGLASQLLSAVIATESAGRPCAVSSKGAQGLMQLMPDTAALLGVGDPFDPAQNIDGGARYLSGLLTRYGGDLPLALAAYNAGPGRVDAAGGTPPIVETMRYVEAILNRLKPSGVPEPEKLKSVSDRP